MNILFGIITAQLLLFVTGPGDISKINSLKSEAKAAYVKGDYQVAIDKYKYLVDSLGVKEDEVMLNLANAYFNSKDTVNAPTTYLPLTQSIDTRIKSIANQQLGVMANRNGKFEEALNYFKQALKTAPDNEDARYNYEVLKKKLEKEKREKENNEKNKNKSEEPSEFAKMLKAKADELVTKKLYGEAHSIMIEGLQKDKTVSFYNEFIKRTKEVSVIK